MLPENFVVMNNLVSSLMKQSFKWIRQHLCIKAFYGTSEHAVKTQIWIAITTYVLIAIVKKWFGIDSAHNAPSEMISERKI